jgi:two-component system phosphate regulon sensor histidine kinase PhoR
VGLLGGYALRAMLVRRVRPQAAAQPPPQPDEPDQRFDRLVRALPLGVLMLDRRARITFANPAAAAIFNFERSRVSGQHVIEAIPSLDLERRVDDALGGEASLGPLILTRRGGNRTYALSVYPLTETTEPTRADEAIHGALILAEDQTELIAMERARQEFLSNVSHELRTPLSSAKLMLETVIGSADDEARDIFLPQVLGQVDRLGVLVQKLVEQARAQSGDVPLKIERVDLESIVQPIVRSFGPQAEAKRVDLSVEEDGNPRVDVDRDRIAQVVVNLVDNALRYTQIGGTVTVKLSSDKDEALITVADSGIGIPFKDLPHIFERFYVVDRSRAREVSGAGLGLAIVKQIIDAHKGSIGVESRLGRGTKFICRLPLA